MASVVKPGAVVNVHAAAAITQELACTISVEQKYATGNEQY
jgi:hypothetical protein